MSASTPGRHPLRGNGAMRVFLCLRDHEGEGKDAALSVDDEDKTTVKETKAKDGRNKSFSCEEAFPPTASSGDIFHTAVRPLLLHALACKSRHVALRGAAGALFSIRGAGLNGVRLGVESNPRCTHGGPVRLSIPRPHCHGAMDTSANCAPLLLVFKNTNYLYYAALCSYSGLLNVNDGNE